MARVITGEQPSTETRKLSPGDASQDQEFCRVRNGDLTSRNLVSRGERTRTADFLHCERSSAAIRFSTDQRLLRLSSR